MLTEDASGPSVAEQPRLAVKALRDRRVASSSPGLRGLPVEMRSDHAHRASTLRRFRRRRSQISPAALWRPSTRPTDGPAGGEVEQVGEEALVRGQVVAARSRSRSPCARDGCAPRGTRVPSSPARPACRAMNSGVPSAGSRTGRPGTTSSSGTGTTSRTRSVRPPSEPCLCAAASSDGGVLVVVLAEQVLVRGARSRRLPIFTLDASSRRRPARRGGPGRPHRRRCRARATTGSRSSEICTTGGAAPRRTVLHCRRHGRRRRLRR